jgi:hypothetical protein
MRSLVFVLAVNFMDARSSEEVTKAAEHVMADPARRRPYGGFHYGLI